MGFRNRFAGEMWIGPFLGIVRLGHCLVKLARVGELVQHSDGKDISANEAREGRRRPVTSVPATVALSLYRYVNKHIIYIYV